MLSASTDLKLDSMVVDSVLEWMLRLPKSEHSLVYYVCLLTTTCKLVPSVSQCVSALAVLPCDSGCTISHPLLVPATQCVWKFLQHCGGDCSRVQLLNGSAALPKHQPHVRAA